MHPGDHIRRGGPEDLPLLEPLWVSVHHAHAESMPDSPRTWMYMSRFGSA